MASARSASPSAARASRSGPAGRLRRSSTPATIWGRSTIRSESPLVHVPTSADWATRADFDLPDLDVRRPSLEDVYLDTHPTTERTVDVAVIRWLIRRRRVRKAAAPAEPAVRRASGGRWARPPPDPLRPRGFLRNRQGRFFTVVLPLRPPRRLRQRGRRADGGADRRRRPSTYYVPGLSALAVSRPRSSTSSSRSPRSARRAVLKRRRATPVPAWVLIAGRALTAISVSLATLTMHASSSAGSRMASTCSAAAIPASR